MSQPMNPFTPRRPRLGNGRPAADRRQVATHSFVVVKPGQGRTLDGPLDVPGESARPSGSRPVRHLGAACPVGDASADASIPMTKRPARHSPA